MRQIFIFLAMSLMAATASAEIESFQTDILYFKGQMPISITMKTASQVSHEFCHKKGFYGSNMAYLKSRPVSRTEREIVISRIECGRSIDDLSRDALESLSQYDKYRLDYKTDSRNHQFYNDSEGTSTGVN